MTLIDLSAPIAQSPRDWPDELRVDIEFADHAAGTEVVETLFGIDPELLRDREGWANETFLRFGTHSSTHSDAPYHYNSTVEGQPARTIDELPLEWFRAPGVVLDFTTKADGDPIRAQEMRTQLDSIGHELKPLDIVLVRTDRDRHYQTLQYVALGPGVTAEATRWLHAQGVRVMGIDAWGWDRPLWMQAEDAKRENQRGIFWEAHQVGLEYSQIERLHNLAALPATGFTISCFPLKILGASGAPARVVASIP